MIYQIDNRQYDNQTGFIHNDKQKIKLTNIQKKLLDYFLKNPNKIINKQTLIDEVWNTIVSTNSVNQVVAKLRNYLEDDSSNPKIIITHFGQGYSFELNFTDKEHKDIPTKKHTEKNPLNKFIWLISIFLIFGLSWYVFQPTNTKQLENLGQQNKKDKQIIVLPTKFDQHIDEVEQSGFRQFIKSAITIFDDNEQTLYDDTSLTTKQSLEKHFNIEKELLIVRSNISKKDKIYQAIIELTDGIKTIKKTTIQGKDIAELMRGQMNFIAQNTNMPQKHNPNANQMLIKALGYQNLGNVNQAQALLENILEKDTKNIQARLSLANLLIEENQLEKAQSHLNTLKTTTHEQSILVEIQLAQASIKFKHKQYQDLITDLVLFQSQHLNIKNIHKAKIQLQIGNAYIELANPREALKSFKTSLVDIDEQLNPLIYAQSYYGQGAVMITQKIDESVEELFKKTIQYAKSAHNLKYQILSLNKLSHIYFNSYKWDKAISTIKKTVDLSELANDKESQIVGLSSLVEIYNQRGYFTQAFVINQKIKTLAQKYQSDKAQIIYLFHDAVAALNTFDWQRAKQRIEEHYQLSVNTHNYAYLLNNAFLTLEIRLLTHELDDFIDTWNQRVAFIKENGFERIQVYMDFYLARYYKQKKDNKKSLSLLRKIIAQAEKNDDIKMIVDANNQLAEIHLENDAKQSLAILNSLEKYNPHPNPYLELKAKALSKLGKNMKALTLLNQAKLSYNESWTAENQMLLEHLQNQIKR